MLDEAIERKDHNYSTWGQMGGNNQPEVKCQAGEREDRRSSGSSDSSASVDSADDNAPNNECWTKRSHSGDWNRPRTAPALQGGVDTKGALPIIQPRDLASLHVTTPRGVSHKVYLSTSFLHVITAVMTGDRGMYVGRWSRFWAVIGEVMRH